MHVGKGVGVTLYSQIIGRFIQFPTKGKRGVRPGKSEVLLFLSSNVYQPIS